MIKPVLLIVDDDENHREILKMTIEEETDFRPVTASTGEQALRIVCRIRPTICILDYRLPDMSGLELYDRLQELVGEKELPALLVSASQLNIDTGSRPILIREKPFEIEVLILSLYQLLKPVLLTRVEKRANSAH